MGSIHVTSEIKPLKKVLLHRPGKELLSLTPETLERLLFDDIPAPQREVSCLRPGWTGRNPARGP